jgi:hypothetical protein
LNLRIAEPDLSLMRKFKLAPSSMFSKQAESSVTERGKGRKSFAHCRKNNQNLALLTRPSVSGQPSFSLARRRRKLGPSVLARPAFKCMYMYVQSTPFVSLTHWSSPRIAKLVVSSRTISPRVIHNTAAKLWQLKTGVERNGLSAKGERS